MSLNIRLVRPAPDPLGLYIRCGRIAQKDLQSFITAEPTAFTGTILEASRADQQKELLTLALERKLDVVLDPQTQAMATIGGFSAAMNSLPWSKKRPHVIADLKTAFQRRQFAEAIAQFAIEKGFTQVISPTHLIAEPSDPWLEIDIEVSQFLRAALDRSGGLHIQINYSLALTYEAFRTASMRLAILEKVRAAAADSLWLNVDGCGSDSSPTAITRYSDAATEFHALGLPIIADHIGGLAGLSLLAFGAVGGLAHGLTMGERFSSANWRKAPNEARFGQSVRVYVPELDLLLKRVDAELLFESGGRAKSAFGCKNTNCCARGIPDMLVAPARHFLYQRTRQVAGLSQIPESLRPQQFLEELLRPASDKALLAAKLDLPFDLAKKAETQSKRLNDMRITLGAYSSKRRNASFAQHPVTRSAREALG